VLAKPKFRSSRCLRGAEAWLLKAFRSAAAASFRMLSKEREALSSQCSSLSVASNFGVWAKNKSSANHLAGKIDSGKEKG
jgi:hypothetical protein